jgi:hypothetical protein
MAAGDPSAPAGHPPEEGKLVVPGRAEHIPVRVRERHDEAMMLVVVLDVDKGVELSPDQSIVYETPSPRGLVRVRGEGCLEDVDLVRFQPLAPAEVVQRREFVRVDAALDVRIHGEEGAKPTRTVTVDVSAGGMRLIGAVSLQAGSLVEFSLQLGDQGPPIEGHARVVRTGIEGEYGLAFERLPKGQHERIFRFVLDRQRAAIARRQD